jgi:hypothetical protein
LILVPGSKGFFLGSWVLLGYILYSPPLDFASLATLLIKVSCPIVGGLNLPKVIDIAP